MTAAKRGMGESKRLPRLKDPRVGEHVCGGAGVRLTEPGDGGGVT